MSEVITASEIVAAAVAIERRAKEDEAFVRAAKVLRWFGSLTQAESEATARLQSLRSQEEEINRRIADAHEEHSKTKDAATDTVKNAKAEASRVQDEGKRKANEESARIIAAAQAEADSIGAGNEQAQAAAKAAAGRVEAARKELAEVEGRLAAARESIQKLLG